MCDSYDFQVDLYFDGGLDYIGLYSDIYKSKVAYCSVISPSYDLNSDDYDFYTLNSKVERVPLTLNKVHLRVYQDYFNKLIVDKTFDLSEMTLDEVNKTAYELIEPYIKYNVDKHDEVYDYNSLLLRKYLPSLEKFTDFNAKDNTNIYRWRDVSGCEEFHFDCYDKEYRFKVYIRFNTDKEEGYCTRDYLTYDLTPDEYQFMTKDSEDDEEDEFNILEVESVELIVYKYNFDIVFKKFFELSEFTLEEINAQIYDLIKPYHHYNIDHCDGKEFDEESLVLRKYLPSLEKFVIFNAATDTNLMLWNVEEPEDEFRDYPWNYEQKMLYSTLYRVDKILYDD